MRTSLLACLLGATVVLAACKRNDIETLETYSVLVEKLEWNDGSRESWSYDANDQLERTVGASPTSSAIERDFVYNGHTLGVLQKTSIKEDTFYFDAARRISRIEEYNTGLRKDGGFRLDFTYNGAGRIIRMDFGSYKGTDYILRATTQYTWNTDGLLTQIRTTPAGRQEEIVYDLSHQNTPFLFNEWAFVNRYHLVDMQYEIWNVPVLKCMDRLPTRIVRTHKTNGQISDQSTQEFSYTADAIGRLLRRDMPGGNWMKITYQPSRQTY